MKSKSAFWEKSSHFKNSKIIRRKSPDTDIISIHHCRRFANTLYMCQYSIQKCLSHSSAPLLNHNSGVVVIPNVGCNIGNFENIDCHEQKILRARISCISTAWLTNKKKSVTSVTIQFRQLMSNYNSYAANLLMNKHQFLCTDPIQAPPYMRGIIY